MRYPCQGSAAVSQGGNRRTRRQSLPPSGKSCRKRTMAVAGAVSPEIAPRMPRFRHDVPYHAGVLGTAMTRTTRAILRYALAACAPLAALMALPPAARADDLSHVTILEENDSI